MSESLGPQIASELATEPRTEPAPAYSRPRKRELVRLRLTGIVVITVGITLIFGAVLLRTWVQATLTNDLRARNERIVSFMADSLSKGRVPAELFASVNTLEGQLDQQTSADLFGRAANAEQVLSTTYFYLDGQGLSDLNFKVDDQGRLVLFGRQGPPRPTAAGTARKNGVLADAGGQNTVFSVQFRRQRWTAGVGSEVVVRDSLSCCHFF